MPVGVTPRADEMALIDALTNNKKSIDRQLAENHDVRHPQNDSIGDLEFINEFINKNEAIKRGGDRISDLARDNIDS